ncbi:hypothetical protein [Devosia sp.]|uniref:hypothetical protein n=1 Tax=Devosia sp. TaxID=1871048 RepID=UPI00326743BB
MTLGKHEHWGIMMLRLLGSPHVEGSTPGDRPLPLKAYLLVAVLQLDYAGIGSRDALSTFLWPNVPAANAQANLRQLIAQVRRWQTSSTVQILTIERRFIRIADGCASDVLALLSAKAPTRPNEVSQLCALHRGDLLAGTEMWLDSDLAQWLSMTRARINRHFATNVIAAGASLAAPELELAFARALEFLPYEESLVRARMNNLAALGQFAAAHAVFMDHSNRLRLDLNATPELLTQALAARLGTGQNSGHGLSPSTVEPMQPATEIAVRPVPRVIILPPAPLGNTAPADVELAISLTSDISLSLCRMRTLSMLAPYTARKLAGSDPASTISLLDLDYIVTTSILPGSRHPRLAFTLVRTRSSEILVADEVPLDPGTLLRSQASIAAAIAANLTGKIGAAELQSFRSTGVKSAYIHYLLGTELLQNNDLARLRGARRHMAQALKLSPEYVPALSALARTMSIEWLMLGRPDRTLLIKAKSLATRAVQIDPLEASGHRELGHASMYLGDLDASAEYFDIAHERAPNYADILADQADILVHSSRMREAKRCIDNAISLNPLAPDEYYWISGSAEFFLGNYRAALTTLQKMQDQTMVDRLISASAAMIGNLDLAASHRERWLSKYPDFRLSDVAEFVPHRSSSDVEHYVHALVTAGFS